MAAGPRVGATSPALMQGKSRCTQRSRLRERGHAGTGKNQGAASTQGFMQREGSGARLRPAFFLHQTKSQSSPLDCSGSLELADYALAGLEVPVSHPGRLGFLRL